MSEECGSDARSGGVGHGFACIYCGQTFLPTGSERFKRFLASENPASLLFRSPPANNLKDRPRLKRAYACVCKLNLSSALHNGYFVASDLIDENLSHRTGAIG